MCLTVRRFAARWEVPCRGWTRAGSESILGLPPLINRMRASRDAPRWRRNEALDMNVEPATPPPAAQAPRLVALATAVPPHVYRQGEVRAFAAHLFSDVIEGNARLIHVYEHAHIEQRHLCVTLEWLGADHEIG